MLLDPQLSQHVVKFTVVRPYNMGSVRRPTVVKQRDPEQVFDERRERSINGMLGKRAHNM
jgi:hypothetical protein